MLSRWLLPAPPAPPMEGLVPGRYGAIYADPPWAFDAYSGDGGTPHRTAEDHYRTVGLDGLARLPVGDYAARDCALFMWTVGSHLDQAIALAKAWGFTYKTDAFYWAKQKLVAPDQIDLFTGDLAPPRMGFGYWTRKQIEPCLLFTRGRPRRRNKGVRQLIVEPIREHSRKPDVLRDLIMQLVDGPYAELFARQSAAGWDCWGNEIGKFDAPPPPAKADAKPAPERRTRHEGEFTLVDGGAHG